LRLDRPLLRLTWAELRRRKVARAGFAYALVAWIVLQLAEITYEPLGLPGWALTWTVLAAVLGLPVVLVLSWFFDVSRSGFAREKGRAGAAGAAFAVVVVLLTVAGLGWWLADVYAPGRDEPEVAVAGAKAVISTRSDAPSNAIAVLPFGDMSPDGDQGFLGDGLAEELLDRLARSPGLKVAARTSSFAFRDHAGDIRDVARQLNVRWVVEGSLRKSGGRVRVTAQLIDAADGFHVWSDTYEHPDSDLFALQDEVTAAIAGALSPHVAGFTIEAEGDSGTVDVDALQAYLEGRQAWRQRTPVSLQTAQRLFSEAVARDPRFARAWSGLADTYLLQADYGTRALDEAIRLAEPAAVRAVSLGPQLGEAWASVGLLRMTVGQRDAARRSLEEAMRLDPRYEMAPMWLAAVYASEGRYDRQRDVLERAAELNPLEPVINSNLAGVVAAQGEPDAARDRLLRVLAVLPDEAVLLRGLADIEMGRGELEPALRAARAAYAGDPDAPANITTLVNVLLRIEAFDAAHGLVTRLPAHSHVRVMLLQELELRRGGDAMTEELADWLRTLSTDRITENERTALMLGGLARLRAGAVEEARSLLERAAGDIAELAAEPRRLEAASLLLVALRQSGADGPAARWHEALVQASGPHLARAGDAPEIRYARALLALESGQRAQAIDLLEQAVASGFCDRWLLRHDPRLASLVDDSRVQALQHQLEQRLAAMRDGLTVSS
jgi:TolB-like protein/tetratricopeptide (TPR) repeat protein